MSTVNVKITLDPSKLNPFLADVTNGSAQRAAARTAARANANVRNAGRVRTGALASSYRETRQPSSTVGVAGYEVGSLLDYAMLQEDGAGPSDAGPGRVLRFMPKGSSVFIFRRRTRGFSGAHQLRNAFNALSAQDFLP